MRFPIRVCRLTRFKVRLKNWPHTVCRLVDCLISLVTLGYIQTDFSMFYFLVFRDDGLYFKRMTRKERVEYYYRMHHRS